MDSYLQIQAESRNGMCVLRIGGELDKAMLDTFTTHADAAVRAVPGPVIVDLAGLTFIDAAGARALAQLVRSLSVGRLADVIPCPPAVRRVFRLLCLPPPEYWLSHRRTAADAGTQERVSRLQHAVLDASAAQLEASGTLVRVQDTCIRLASTLERSDLIRERARQTLTRTRAAREHLARSRQQAAA